jgi:hypothetical protein
MSNQRQTMTISAVNLVVLTVAFLPGLIGRDYPEPISPYLQLAASVWLVGTSLYMSISLYRRGLAEMRERHARELAEMRERHAREAAVTPSGR